MKRAWFLVASFFLVSAAGESKETRSATHLVENLGPDRGAIDSQLASAAGFLRGLRMSEKGIATVLTGLKLEQQEQWRILKKGFELNRAVEEAARAQPFQLAEFEQALNRQNYNQVEAVTSAHNSELEILHALSPRDREVFAQAGHGNMNVHLGFPSYPIKGMN